MERQVITVNYEDSILNVLEIIEKEHIGYVPAVDKDSKLVGLVTKSSLLSILSDQLINKEVQE